VAKLTGSGAFSDPVRWLFQRGMHTTKYQ